MSTSDEIYRIFKGITIGIVVALIVVLFVLLIIKLIAKIKLFKKANMPWWKAIIPIYSDYVFYCNVTKISAIWFVLDIVCVVVPLLVTVCDICASFITVSPLCKTIFIILNRGASFYHDNSKILVPLLTIIIMFVNAVAFYNLAILLNQNKVEYMILGSVFAGIVIMIVGFSKYTYNNEAVVKNSGFFNI